MIEHPSPTWSRLLRAIAVLSVATASIAAVAAPIWDQSDFTLGQGPGDGGVVGNNILPVADFTTAGPVRIAGYRVWMTDAGGLLGGDGLANGVFSTFSGTLSWYLFADAASTPGALIAAGDTMPTVLDTGLDSADSVPEDIFSLASLLDTPIDLPAAGHYWFGVREGVVGAPNGAGHDDTSQRWLNTTSLRESDSYFFGNGVTQSVLFGPIPHDFAFALDGEVLAVPEPSSVLLTLMGLCCIGLVANGQRRRR